MNAALGRVGGGGVGVVLPYGLGATSLGSYRLRLAAKLRRRLRLAVKLRRRLRLAVKL